MSFFPNPIEDAIDAINNMEDVVLPVDTQLEKERNKAEKANVKLYIMLAISAIVLLGFLYFIWLKKKK